MFETIYLHQLLPLYVSQSVRCSGKYSFYCF